MQRDYENKPLRRMKRLCGIVMTVLLLTILGATASEAQPEHHAVNLQFLYPVATSSDPDLTTNLRLSLLYGRVGSVRGLDLNGVAATTGSDVHALQLTGAYSRIGGLFQGMSVTGGMQHLSADGVGFQFSGLANYVEGRFVGVQYSGLLNHVRGGFVGFQFAGALNSNDGPGGFLQIASIANVNVGPFGGLQLSALFNHGNSHVSGAQAALLNFAESMSGAQIGLLNLAQTFSGVQVGVINISKINTGIPIGFYNSTDSSNVDLVIYGTNLAAINGGIRTVVNNWSSVIGGGYRDTKSDAENSGFLSWHFGRLIELGSRWSLTADLGYVHIIPKAYDDPLINDRLHFALQARLLAEVALGRKIAIFAGGGVSTRFSEYSSHASSETDPLLVGGVSLF